eukprot:2850597-Pleurochrysis_carterae.AAC.1
MLSCLAAIRSLWPLFPSYRAMKRNGRTTAQILHNGNVHSCYDDLDPNDWRCLLRIPTASP